MLYSDAQLHMARVASNSACTPTSSCTFWGPWESIRICSKTTVTTEDSTRKRLFTGDLNLQCRNVVQGICHSSELYILIKSQQQINVKNKQFSSTLTQFS